MKEVGNRLHMQIVVDVLTHVPLTSNLNFGNTTLKQEARVKAKARMLGRKCVAIGMQQPTIVREHELLVGMQQQY